MSLLADASSQSLVGGGVIRDIQQTELYRLFSAYLHIAHCFGLGYMSGNVWHALLSVCTGALIAFDIFRGCTFIYSAALVFDQQLVFKCLLALYATHTAIGYKLVRTIDRDELRRFVHCWQVANEWHDNAAYYKWIRTSVHYGVVYVLAVSVVNGVYVALGSIQFILSFPFMQSYLYAEQLAFANGLIVFWTSIAFFLPQAIYLSICLVLVFEYITYNRILLPMKTTEIMLNLPMLRYRHLVITKLTGT